MQPDCSKPTPENRSDNNGAETASPIPNRSEIIGKYLVPGVGLGILALVLFYFSDPLHHNIFPPCSFHEATGLYCVGCGGTRATYLLLHGRILESLRYNCLCVVVLPFALYVFLVPVLKNTKHAIPQVRLSMRSGLLLVVLLSGFMIVRNIPLKPCIYLAPPIENEKNAPPKGVESRSQTDSLLGNFFGRVLRGPLK